MSNDTQHLEQRISVALSRLSAAVAALGAAPAVQDPSPAFEDCSSEVSDLQAALAEAQDALILERSAKETLAARLADLREGQDARVDALEARLVQANSQLDVQGLDLQRLRQSNVQLRETLRSLREATETGVPDAHLLNKTMLAELEALRASRMAEIAEMDEILAGLDPLIDPAEESADA